MDIPTPDESKDPQSIQLNGPPIRLLIEDGQSISIKQTLMKEIDHVTVRYVLQIHTGLFSDNSC